MRSDTLRCIILRAATSAVAMEEVVRTSILPIAMPRSRRLCGAGWKRWPALARRDRPVSRSVGPGVAHDPRKFGRRRRSAVAPPPRQLPHRYRRNRARTPVFRLFCIAAWHFGKAL